MQCIRANMKRLRVRQGLTQQSLAEKAGLDYNYLQKIESGRWGGLRVSTDSKSATFFEDNTNLAASEFGAYFGDVYQWNASLPVSASNLGRQTLSSSALTGTS